MSGEFRGDGERQAKLEHLKQNGSIEKVTGMMLRGDEVYIRRSDGSFSKGKIYKLEDDGLYVTVVWPHETKPGKHHSKTTETEKFLEYQEQAQPGDTVH